LSLFRYFWEKSEKELGEERPAHFVAITDPGSSLASLGHQKGFREVFTADPNVGGRYSVLTHFGLVPAALVGIDLEKLLAKAQDIANKTFKARSVDLNLGALLGILLGLGEKRGKDKLTILTDESIAPISAWLEQLIAESSGKQGRGIVPIVDEPAFEIEHYTMDRLFVYLRQAGEHDLFVELLQKAGHAVVVLDVSDLYDIGTQFYLWEFAIAVGCSIIGINAFDQPDVQDSKDRTKKILSSYTEHGSLNEPEVVWARQGFQVYGRAFGDLNNSETISEVIKLFTAQGTAGDYVAINAYLPRNDDTHAQLNKLRRDISRMTGLPTTLGFGPRFLHSTGQLHKGGADNGLFIQITQTVAEDLAIPGAPYSFGILALAQAQGDLDALLERGRRAIRIHLPAGASLKPTS
jgi:transaldolase/glucose-6-phosphate isomerase